MSTGYLVPDPALREFSDLGVVLAGAKLYTYVSGTPSTPLATYSDSALTIPNTNPIVASAGGLLSPIYLTPGVAYKLLLTDADDVTVPGWPRDPVTVPAAGITAPVLVTQGGTGIIVGISGGLLYFSGTTAIASSALLAAHGVLIGGGAGAAPFTTAAGVAGQALLSGGPAADPSFQNLSVALFDKSFTEQIVTNTSTETAIYSLALPANTLIAARALRLKVTADILNTSGGAVNLTVKITLGGTTIFSSGLTSIANGLSVAPTVIDALINANNATNAQRVFAEWRYLTSNTADGAGTTPVTASQGGHSSLAIDMTAIQTLAVTVTWASAATTITVKRWAAILELLQ